MSKFTDQQYLKTDQYKDASNLDARVVLHQRFSTNKYGWFNWIFDILSKLPLDAKVLELGCGHGLLWKENADRSPSTWDIKASGEEALSRLGEGLKEESALAFASATALALAAAFLAESNSPRD